MEKFRGVIDFYDIQQKRGVIRESDGYHISFGRENLMGLNLVKPGDVVFYDITDQGDEAINVKVASIKSMNPIAIGV